MLRIILYIGIALTVVYGVGFLLTRKYRTRELIWLPVMSLGVAVELTAYLASSSLRPTLIIAGLAIVVGALVLGRKPKKRQLNGSTPVA